jgi:hypothetical protein
VEGTFDDFPFGVDDALDLFALDEDEVLDFFGERRATERESPFEGYSLVTYTFKYLRSVRVEAMVATSKPVPKR